MSKTISQRVIRFNRGRNEVLLLRKFERMRSGPFPFFRGSCHLFFEDWKAKGKLDRAPLGWISGDLHLENFGAYKGDNRLVYFDLNDFDEAVLAPCTWELARFATSVRLAADEIGLAGSQADALVEHFLVSYAAVLERGKARWVERAIAEGAVKELLDRAEGRSRKALLDKRTDLRDGRRRIRLDGEHALAATSAEKEQVKRFLRRHGRHHERSDHFKVLDVARRVAGTGSLGIDRYIVLVEGKGSPDQNHLIDIKMALPSAPAAYLKHLQPRWDSEAQRVVTIQNRCQAVSPAGLGVADIESRHFVMRELQPVEDRLELESLAQSGHFESALSTMALVVASAHLRSSGRGGSAIGDEWIEFGTHTGWIDRVGRYAARYHKTVVKNWLAFCKGG